VLETPLPRPSRQCNRRCSRPTLNRVTSAKSRESDTRWPHSVEVELTSEIGAGLVCRVVRSLHVGGHTTRPRNLVSVTSRPVPNRRQHLRALTPRARSNSCHSRSNSCRRQWPCSVDETGEGEVQVADVRRCQIDLVGVVINGETHCSTASGRDQRASQIINKIHPRSHAIDHPSSAGTVNADASSRVTIVTARPGNIRVMPLRSGSSSCYADSHTFARRKPPRRRHHEGAHTAAPSTTGFTARRDLITV